ncbi:MAG: preprotein translocase subunit SecG [Halobacteriovoraceae bacterium]|nr:preprotein translocase subunit SecG [Halobacteriovoraceae bacterium]|tara:strand:+ start:1969 stop:2364 length:396 start_codon:yes stop_codon:yes gene_type:complete
MDQSLVTGLTIFHVIVCILLTVTVLVQFGKGAEAGAMMGGGSSQAIFTTNSKGNFFTKLTTALAILFMVNSITLTILTTKASSSSIMDSEAPVASPLNNDSMDETTTEVTPTENTTSADNSEDGSKEAIVE